MSFIRRTNSFIYCGRLRILAAVIAFAGLTTQAKATSYMPTFDARPLLGVDTVLVGSGGGPSGDLLPSRKPSAISVEDILTRAVGGSFSRQPWLSVKGFRGFDAKHLSDPNVIFFSFAFSARQVTTNGQSLKIGSLALQLWKYNSDGTRSAIAIQPVTYPFIIPNSSEGFDQQITEGAQVLVSYLPPVFDCLKAGGNAYGCAVVDPWIGYAKSASNLSGKNGETP